MKILNECSTFCYPLIIGIVFSIVPISFCFSQDVTLSTQAEVDAFDTSITTISGNLTIDTTSTTDPITSLLNLSNLTAIDGDLAIGVAGNSFLILSSLNGLHNLTTIGGSLMIINADSLQNLNPLSNLTDLGENLIINANNTLQNIDALSNLTTISGDVMINNDELQDLDGLSNITAVEGNLDLFLNDLPQNMGFLPNLITIGGDFHLHSFLQGLDGLYNLTSIEGTLTIQLSPFLLNLDGLSNLTTINGSVNISVNSSLQNLDGLSNLTSVGQDLTITSNASLTNCCAIQNLLLAPGAIGGIVDISTNPSECSSENEVINSICNLFISTLANFPCMDNNNGTIQIDIFPQSFPATPYTYTIIRTEDGQTESGQSNDESFVFDNLEAGTYDVSVTDAMGNTAVLNGTVLPSLPGVDIAISTTDISCNGQTDGTAAAIVNGSTFPYIYNWSNGGMDSIVENLSAGVYSLTVTDVNACTSIESITISDPDPLMASITAYDQLCFGENNGSITFETNGGTPPYTYAIDGVNFTSQIVYSGLFPGIYAAVVRDTKGCTYQEDITITEADALNINIEIITTVSCNAGGVVEAMVTGGTSPYSYNWSNGETDSIVMDLGEGVYSLTVVDAAGCAGVEQVTLADPNAIAGSIIGNNSGCFGENSGSIEFENETGGTAPYLYAIDGTNFSNQAFYDELPPGLYTAVIQDINGCIYEEAITIEEAEEIVVSIGIVNDISCIGDNDGAVEALVNIGVYPSTYDWSNGEVDIIAANLSAGNYTATVTDIGGCTGTGSIVLTESDPLTVSLSANNSTCFGDNNGSIQFDEVVGGTSPYHYAIDGMSFSNQLLYNELSQGTYTIAVLDDKACMYEETIIIEEAAEIALNLGLDTIIALGDSLLIEPEHNVIVVDTFIWVGTDCINCPEVVIAPTSALNLSLTIADLNGCLASDELLLRVNTNTDLFVPNAFSPNNDGVNDRLFPNAAPQRVNIKEFVVLDRWGNLVFKRHNFEPNDPSQGWDGTLKGQLLHAGVFVWYAKTTLLNGEEMLFKGDVILVR